MKTLSEQAAEKQKDQHKGGLGIRASQTMDKDFSKVNASWVSKTLTFDAMLKQAQEFQALCKDIEGLRLSDLLSKDALLKTKDGSKYDLGNLVLSPTSLSQLGNFLGIPGNYLDFLGTADKGLFDTNVNRRIESAVEATSSYRKALVAAKAAGTDKPSRPDHPDRGVFLRLLNKDGITTLRAALTNRYAVLNNLPLIEVLGEAIPNGRVSHLHYDGDTLRANILIPDALRTEKDSDYGGGISVLNNETGRFMFRQRPFVFTAICYNGNIWDREDGTTFQRRHLGNIVWSELRKSIITNLNEQIPLVTGHVEKFLSLKNIPLTQELVEQSIVFVGRRERLTQSAMQDWAQAFKEELTVGRTISAFSFVQGLTRAAQKQERFEAQELMETLSARLIDGNWEKLTKAASNAVTPEEAREALTVAIK